MEKPLLGGESARRSTSWLRDQSARFFRRSEAISYGSPYQKAAALVDLAEDGVGLPEQILDHSSYETAAKFYFTYIRFNFLWTLNYFALIVLNFLEKPLWCEKYSADSCSNREYYFLGQLPYLTSVESLVYEGLTLIILIIHSLFPISYEGFHLYWKSPLSKLKVLFLLILVADLLVDGLYMSPVTDFGLPFRVAPYIRVIVFILSMRELRDSILILGGMLSTYFNVLALGLLFLLFSSWVAYVMFEDTLQGKTVFTSFGTTLYEMLVFFTTSNNPDVWIPAYKASRWYCLFFMLYVLLGVYFVTNLILAVVYESFKSQLVKQLAEKDRMRKRILGKAFNLIDKNDQGFLNKDQCIHLFEALNKYRTLPNISREDFELIFDELDDSHDFKLDIENNSAQQVWQKVEFVFGWLYVVEMALKIYAFGFENYWRDGQNRFDFFITWVIVIVETTTFLVPDDFSFLSNGEWIRYLLLARMLRLFRLLMHVQRYRAFLATFLSLVPSLMPYLGTIFCVMCIYCSLGVQIFGGLVYAGNPKLDGTDLDENDYLLFNFNDYPNGMVTLFNLLVMNNWEIWMQSYIDLTGTSWTCIYFISFYLIAVLLLLSLVVAFVLEAFFAEMELETLEKCEDRGQVGTSYSDL